MSGRDWFYPPESWPVHELCREWYKMSPNALCREIDQAGISSKRCCSVKLLPAADEEDWEEMDTYEVVRFVRGLGGPQYPEMWGLEVLRLQVDKKPKGWTASLLLDVGIGRPFSTWRTLWFPSGGPGLDDPHEFTVEPDGTRIRCSWDAPEAWHYIYVGSMEEKRRLLEWVHVFSKRHGFHHWEEFPIKERHLQYDDPDRLDFRRRWTTQEGELLNIEYPELITSKDVRTGETVTIQANPRFDEYMEFCRAQRLRNAFRGAFAFNEEPVLAELEADKKWRPRVEAYRSYLRGRYQDDIARDLGAGQSTVSTWLGMVRGEVGRRMGAAYEAYLEGSHRLRPDVSRVTRDGAQGRPDLVVELRDGSYEVISVKCFKSDRSTVTVQLEEFQPELNEAYRLAKTGESVRLLVDYLNLETGQHEVRELNLDKPPQRLNFRKSAG